MMRIATRCVLVLAVTTLAACGGDGNSSGIPDACNPLGGDGCMLPYPSMAYVTVDGSTQTGFRLDIPREAMPVNVDGVPVDPAWHNRWDGYSLVGPMLAMFPNGVSADGLPGWRDPEASLAADSPIVLVDIGTGERAAFFAEVDQNQSDVTKRALIIRPLERLHAKAHYAVGIKTTVKDASGAPLVASAGFAALRDGQDFSHPKFAALAARAPTMFEALASAGAGKDELVLAWDFVTASDEFLRSNLTAMREAALPAIGDKGAKLTFTATAQDNLPTTYKRFLGTYQAPNFLTNGEEDVSILRRSSDGAPLAMGLRDANFAAIIPKCVETQPLPRPTIVFGHGLFGSAEGYLADDFVLDLANDKCFIIVAGDWIGLTERQIPLAPLAINDLNRGRQITEKLAQSVIDFIALESITRGPLAESPEFQFNGAAVIDPEKTYYVGGSLGGIMGNVLMAYDPNLTRGVLAVPGGNWSLLLERSAAWALLMGAAQGAYEDPAVYQLNLALGLGMGLEPYDPITTAAHVIKDPLFGQDPKSILMWYAIGDSLVTNISTEMTAREMGIPLVTPAVREAWKLTPMAGPLPSGITVYDDHKMPIPADTNIPPAEDNGTHSGINRKPAALRQVQDFLLDTQQVIDECKLDNAPAKCDCATGACE